MRFYLLSIVALTFLCIVSCKTSEANYREAYEKAIAGRDSLTAIENTIYGRHRRSTATSISVVGVDTVEQISTFVKISDGGGGTREGLKPFSVVVGRFKQLVNAKSLRERLVDAGFPETFIVQTAEPYYYILLNSFPTRDEAAKACIAVRNDKNFPIALGKGLPLVLYCPR